MSTVYVKNMNSNKGKRNELEYFGKKIHKYCDGLKLLLIIIYDRENNVYCYVVSISNGGTFPSVRSGTAIFECTPSPYHRRTYMYPSMCLSPKMFKSIVHFLWTDQIGYNNGFAAMAIPVMRYSSLIVSMLNVKCCSSQEMDKHFLVGLILYQQNKMYNRTRQIPIEFIFGLRCTIRYGWR